MEITLTHAALVVIGLVVGIGLGVLLARRGPAARNAARIESEHQQYRQEVAQHFARTAELVNGMTDSYKAVFDHLQGGARELMDEETLSRTLADQSDEVITLNRLGWQAASERPDEPVDDQESGAEVALAEEPDSEPENDEQEPSEVISDDAQDKQSAPQQEPESSADPVEPGSEKSAPERRTDRPER